jgi:hypothetical protein
VGAAVCSVGRDDLVGTALWRAEAGTGTSRPARQRSRIKRRSMPGPLGRRRCLDLDV